ncbi:hypothetical protein L3Q82_024290 [Scortum barcoo]|uniref:Uncharacterized protein n=1 Tax=Scortum barcoo TaxID=214431 RepID=A0ACB8WV83_9TELE|nr:hypothetical protein L3Q82_024290 [Scortum barcoo]
MISGLYVLDTRVKRGAELSTDHHLVGGLQLPPPGELLSQIPREAGDIESECASIASIATASIVDAAVRSCGHKVQGSLLRAVRSLYDRSRSLVRIAGSKSDLFPVHVGLRQGCPLSPVLFIIFMDRISRHSQGPEGVQFGRTTGFHLCFLQMILSLLASSGQHISACTGAFCSQV